MVGVSDDAGEPSGVALTFINSLKSNVGIAILTMPYAFARSGWLAAIVMFVGAALCTCFSLHLLRVVLDDCHERNYAEVKALAESDGEQWASDEQEEQLPDIGYFEGSITAQTASRRFASFHAIAKAATNNNRWIVLFADTTMLCAMAGACIAYSSFIVTTVQRFVDWPRLIIAFGLCFAFAFVAFVDRVGGVLVKVAATGVVVLLVGAFTFIVETSSDCEGASEVPAVEWATLAEGFGIASFSNEGIVALAAPIFADMRIASRLHYFKVVVVVIGMCLLLNVSVGMLALFCVHGQAPNLFTDPMDETKVIDAMVIGAMGLQIACTFPQVAFVTLQTIVARLPKSIQENRNASNLVRLIGVIELSRLHANALQALGSKKKTLSGLGGASMGTARTGVLYQCELVQCAPPDFRTRAVRTVAGKCMLAARCDAYNEDLHGGVGRKFREEIVKKLEKMQEPPPAKKVKALEAPIDKPKKRRAGKRIRKLKERFAMSDMRKQANRLQFGKVADDVDNEMSDFGMLGQAGSGTVRVQQDERVGKINVKKAKHHQQHARGGLVSGLATSLAFTPVQGLALENPALLAERMAKAKQQGTESYFDHTSGFFSVGRGATSAGAGLRKKKPKLGE